MLDHFLALLRGHTPLLGDDVAEHQADLPGHVGSITAHVEVRLLLQQVADELGVLPQAVLNVHLLGTLAGEGGDDLQGVAHLVLVGLVKLLDCMSIEYWEDTVSYLEFIRVEEVLIGLAASKEQKRGANLLALGG